MALLAAALGIPRTYAVGVLECLWHFTAQYAPHGDVGQYPDAAIAVGIGWEADPEMLVTTLERCQFLDPHPRHRLVIHNWNKHADQTTQRTVSRSGRTFVGGRKPKRNRTSSELVPNWQNIASGGKAKTLVEHCVKTPDHKQEKASVSTTLPPAANTEKSKTDAELLIDEINLVGHKQFRLVKVNLDLARARLGEHPLPTLRAMVRWRWKTWEPNMRAEYFRPLTLLNASHCESYVGSMPASEVAAFLPAVLVAPTPLALKYAERDRAAREKTHA